MTSGNRQSTVLHPTVYLTDKDCPLSDDRGFFIPFNKTSPHIEVIMAIYNGRLSSLDKAELKRYAGLRGNHDFPDRYIDTACKEALLLAEPKGVYREYDYDNKQHIVASNPPLLIEGSAIRKHLAKSTKVFVMAVTVGEAIEEKSARFFKENEYTMGLLLDAAATTATEQVANQVNSLIDNAAKKKGYTPTWRFSPGYGNWPIKIQHDLARIIKTEEIGLSVTETFTLFPRKSVTAIIGLMPENEEVETRRGCSSCNQIDCISRS